MKEERGEIGRGKRQLASHFPVKPATYLLVVGNLNE